MFHFREKMLSINLVEDILRLSVTSKIFIGYTFFCFLNSFSPIVKRFI